MMYEQVIAAAIDDKKVLSFRYDNVSRTAEPHALGYDSQGHLTLSAWQLKGTRPGWRYFHVSRLTGLSTTDQSFAGPRPGYNLHDKTLGRILRRL